MIALIIVSLGMSGYTKTVDYGIMHQAEANEDDSHAVYVDRRIYKPGDTVKIYGNFRPNMYVGIEIRGEDNILIFFDVVKTDDKGYYERSFKLPPYTKPGNYTVYAASKGYSSTAWFEVVGERIPNTSYTGLLTNTTSTIIRPYEENQGGLSRSVLYLIITLTISFILILTIYYYLNKNR